MTQNGGWRIISRCLTTIAVHSLNCKYQSKRNFNKQATNEWPRAITKGIKNSEDRRSEVIVSLSEFESARITRATV